MHMKFSLHKSLHKLKIQTQPQYDLAINTEKETKRQQSHISLRTMVMNLKGSTSLVIEGYSSKDVVEQIEKIQRNQIQELCHLFPN